jgi:hypothetical protein
LQMLAISRDMPALCASIAPIDAPLGRGRFIHGF